MPIRISDIAQELGVDSRAVLAKAKELGLTNARFPSSTLDKITGEYVKEQMKEATSVTRDAPMSVGAPTVVSTKPGPPPAAVAQATHVLESITLRLSASEPSVRINSRLLYEQALAGNFGFVLEIAESENTQPLRLQLATAEIPRKISVKPEPTLQPRAEIDEGTRRLLRSAYLLAARHSQAADWVNLADYGNEVKKLEPTFQPQGLGERSLGSLVRRLGDLFEMRADEHNPIVYYIREKQRSDPPPSHVLTQTPPEEPVPDAGQSPLSLQKVARGRVHHVKLGYGFIVPDDAGENLFFHASEVVGCTIFDLHPGDLVEYEPGVNDKGLCARRVHRLA